MLYGPIIRRELRAAALRRGQFGLRAFLGILFAMAAVLPAASFVMDWRDQPPSATDLAELKDQCAVGLMIVSVAQVVLMGFLVPGLVAGAIAEEWERNTLPFLLISRLTRLEIVLAKLTGRMLPTLAYGAVGVPLVVATAWVAGIPIGMAALIVLALVSTICVMGAFSILASARSMRTATAKAMAGGLLAAWLIGPPIVVVVPFRLPQPWASLAGWVKSAATMIAPSSPISILTDRGWLAARGPDVLEERLYLMLAIQAGLIAISVAAAAASLRAREPYPYGGDPYRGFRPKCEDDPIVWREYDLPQRRGSAPKAFVLFRYVISLLATLAIVVVRLALTLVLVAVPVGLVIATGWLGFHAFVELARHGNRLPGVFRARTAYNVFARGSTFYLGLVCLIAGAAGAESRISVERIKGTWPVFLTTPLSGEEIVKSKLRVNFLSLRAMAWLLGPVWIVGAACGAVHPLGVFAAAIDLPLAVWAATATGIRIGLRSGSAAAVSTATSLSALGLMVCHGPLLMLLLASRPEIGEFREADITWQIVFACYVVLLPAATAWLARRLTDECFRRFDEWVDRPRRQAAPSLTRATVVESRPIARGASRRDLDGAPRG
jgi:hypothetical protein